MSILSWGKCRLLIKDLDATSGKWRELPTPIENSTILDTTKGDKKEAKIEGGENEDVRYSKNTYVLNFNIRAAKGRNKPIPDSDGVVSHNYSILILPEDETCQTIMIDKAKPSVSDGWTAEDGGIWEYAFDALKPESGDQVKWGVAAVTGSAGNYQVSFTETKEDSDDSE